MEGFDPLPQPCHCATSIYDQGSNLPCRAAYLSIVCGNIPFWNMCLESIPPRHQSKTVDKSFTSASGISGTVRAGFLPRLPGPRFCVDPATLLALWLI